jgi:hypothetical protein
MARPQVADGGHGLQIWRVAASILNKKSRTADRRWLCRLEGWAELTSTTVNIVHPSLRTEISYNVLLELGIPWKLVAIIKTRLNENCNIVLIGQNLT